MVGYPEALTDPSYHGQILVFTYPLIGNYGVPPVRHDEHGITARYESDRIQIQALVVSTCSDHIRHWEAERTLGDWLSEEGIPGIQGIDTRALTLHLRERGTLLGKIVIDGEPEPQWYDPATENVLPRVSRPESQTFADDGTPHIVVVDCGTKNNIIRSLLTRGLR